MRRRLRARPTLALAGLAALATSAPAPAEAGLVALAVEGVLFDVSDAHGILDGSVTLGGPMRALVVYDDATVDGMPSDPSWGHYPQPIPPAILRIEVGTYLFEASGILHVDVIDDGLFESDGLLFRKEQPGVFQDFPGVPGAVVDFLAVDLDDATATALSSDALPTEPPTSPLWLGSGLISVTGCLATEAGASFCPRPPSIALRALPSHVPEPGASVGLGAALAGLGLASRRVVRPRRRRAHRARVASAAPARPAGSGTSSTAPTSQRAIPSPSPSRGRGLPR